MLTLYPSSFSLCFQTQYLKKKETDPIQETRDRCVLSVKVNMLILYCIKMKSSNVKNIHIIVVVILAGVWETDLQPSTKPNPTTKPEHIPETKP